MTIPSSVDYLIVGAGIHGLSTAYHLAAKLAARGQAGSKSILVVDKTAIGAGASGIACGVVRNNYFQPAMRNLMAQCVEVWESDMDAFSYHPVGYMQLSPDCMFEDVASIAEQQHDIGYESVFVDGEKASMDYMKSLFDDWQARGITSVLHEKKGGYANNTNALYGLASKAEALGVRILTGVAVTGFKSANGSSAVNTVSTNKGDVECQQLIVAAGPWAKTLWDMLELPATVDIRSNGNVHKDVPMWVYWSLQEGTLGIDPEVQKTNRGDPPPVIHVDSDQPLYSDVDGSLITEQMWGIYYKPDFHFNGIQGGAAPYRVQTRPDDVQVDPYGVESPDFIVGDDFVHMWTSALAHCQRRFEGQAPKYRNVPSGGIGAFTPDSFPVFDTFRENCYFLADSNHGYKMIGVGKLVAEELLGRESELMKPFRFSRYAEGALHPVSNSPFPWS